MPQFLWKPYNSLAGVDLAAIGAWGDMVNPTVALGNGQSARIILNLAFTANLSTHVLLQKALEPGLLNAVEIDDTLLTARVNGSTIGSFADVSALQLREGVRTLLYLDIARSGTTATYLLNGINIGTVDWLGDIGAVGAEGASLPAQFELFTLSLQYPGDVRYYPLNELRGASSLDADGKNEIVWTAADWMRRGTVIADSAQAARRTVFAERM